MRLALQRLVRHLLPPHEFDPGAEITVLHETAVCEAHRFKDFNRSAITVRTICHALLLDKSCLFIGLID
jgi:hypothetical protein